MKAIQFRQVGWSGSVEAGGAFPYEPKANEAVVKDRRRRE